MTNPADSPLSRIHAEGLDELHEHSGFYLGLGIALIVLGIVALAVPIFSTAVSVFFVGIMLILGGILQAGHAFATRTWSGFFLHLLASILYLITGFLLVANPLAGGISLTLLLAAFFLVEGVFRIVGAMAVRFRSWGWVVLNGIITVILGVLIWRHWPSSGLWVIGLFVGIDMILGGWTFVMLAMATRNLARTASGHAPPAAFA